MFALKFCGISIIVLFVGFIVAFLLASRSMSSHFHEQWVEIRRQDTFNYRKVTSIVRWTTDSSIYEFMFKDGQGYNCFEYEKGFDEYLQVGDLLVKKAGEFRLTVIKPNDSASFSFQPAICDSMKFEYPDNTFFWESIYKKNPRN